MLTLSVIVPVYGGEKTVARCVNSLCRFPGEELEILLINDGSPDGSDAVCRKLAETDQRIRYFCRENRGVSAARNLGLTEARGEYVGFVDCDDWVEEDYFTRFLQAAEKGAPLFTTGYQRVDAGSGRVTGAYEAEAQTLSRAELNRDFLSWYDRLGLPYVWNKFFRLDLLCRHQIRFREDMCYGEDLVFVLEVLKHCDGMDCLGGTPYQYQAGNRQSLAFNRNPAKLESFRKMDEALADYCRETGCPLSNRELYGKYLDRLMILANGISLSRELSRRERKAALRELIQNPYWNQIKGEIIPRGHSQKVAYSLLRKGRSGTLLAWLGLKDQVKKRLGRQP